MRPVLCNESRIFEKKQITHVNYLIHVYINTIMPHKEDHVEHLRRTL